MSRRAEKTNDQLQWGAVEQIKELVQLLGPKRAILSHLEEAAVQGAVLHASSWKVCFKSHCAVDLLHLHQVRYIS